MPSNIKSVLRVFDASGIPVVNQKREGVTLRRGDRIEVNSNGVWVFQGKFLAMDAGVQVRLLAGKRVVPA